MYSITSPLTSILDPRQLESEEPQSGRKNKTHARKKIVPPPEDADPYKVYKYRLAQLIEDLFQQLSKGWKNTLEVAPQQIERLFPLESDATIDKIFKRTIQQFYVYEQICSDLEAQLDIKKGAHPAEAPEPVPTFVYSQFCQQLSDEERPIIMPHCVIAQAEEWLRKETTQVVVADLSEMFEESWGKA